MNPGVGNVHTLFMYLRKHWITEISVSRCCSEKIG